MEETDTAETPSPNRDSTGILRTKISLGRKPSVIMPFYLMKSELPEPSSVTGNMNLLSYYGLDHAWNKFCNNKKLKEELSAFLPHLPGNIDIPAQKDGSSLRQLIEKPPICGKEILPLSNADLAGLKLLPGPIPGEFKIFGAETSGFEKKKHKRKHERTLGDDVDDPERKLRKLKKDEDKEKRRKKKKEKKKKKLAGAEEANQVKPSVVQLDFLDF